MKLPDDNIFWFVRRGEDKKKEQLENNTTKGFLKLLQETNRRTTKTFISQFIEPDFDNITFDYDVQVKLGEISQEVNTLHLVGLSYKGENVAAQAKPEPGEGRVDGLITIEFNDETVVIVLEVKTGHAKLEKKQMGKYRGELGIGSDRCHGMRWKEVYEILKAEYSNSQMGKDRFLLREFTEYLELMQMVPFQGFDREELKNEYSEKYIRKFMRGRDKDDTGTFAQTLYDNRKEYGLEKFTANSNQKSTQIHMIKNDDQKVRYQNHFTAGFWSDNLNFQINIRKRILSNVTQRASSDADENFIQVVKSVLSESPDSGMKKENPLIHLRYQGNFKQEEEDGPYDSSSFNIFTFAYSPELTSNEELEKRLRLLAESVRLANDNDIGSNRSLVIEKQFPYSSGLITNDDLPKRALNFFENLLPVYEHFAKSNQLET